MTIQTPLNVRLGGKERPELRTLEDRGVRVEESVQQEM